MQHRITDSGPHTLPIQWLPARYPVDINGECVDDRQAGKFLGIFSEFIYRCKKQFAL